jgi:hypothetical protein
MPLAYFLRVLDELAFQYIANYIANSIQAHAAMEKREHFHMFNICNAVAHCDRD